MRGKEDRLPPFLSFLFFTTFNSDEHNGKVAASNWSQSSCLCFSKLDEVGNLGVVLLNRAAGVWPSLYREL